MSLKTFSLPSLALKQYLYKLKGYSGFIYGLVVAQLLGVLFSLGPKESMSSGGEGLQITLSTYTSDTVLVFSFAWIIIIAALLISKPYQYLEYSLVANRLSSHLSNAMLLLTYSVFAGTTSGILSLLLRNLMIFNLKQAQFVLESLTLTISNLGLGICVTSLYLLLLAAGAYLIRIIILFNKLLALVLTAGFIVMLRTYPDIFNNFYHFYVGENNLLHFIVKVLLTAAISFGVSILLSNRMEVKR